MASREAAIGRERGRSVGSGADCGGMRDSWEALEDPWDDADDDTPPYWEAGQHLPADARAMGLTHHVPDGALLDFAGSLDSAKPLHRATAWVMLVVFGLPVVLYAVRLLEAVLPG